MHRSILKKSNLDAVWFIHVCDWLNQWLFNYYSNTIPTEHAEMTIHIRNEIE